VVVWRPFESLDLTLRVRSRSLPTSQLTIVLLPTPDDPSSAHVRRGLA
jgi:hypothetical protein